MKKMYSVCLSFLLVINLCSISLAANASGNSYSSSAAGSNALKVSGETKTLSGITVTKTGDASQSDENDFYGKNAAVLASDGANLTIENSTITSEASYGNGVFSYGEGTKIAISGSKITTNSNNSGGVMVTGGGTLNASNLTIITKGGSSAPIRSDRGGGTLYVNGGTYQSFGKGSPAIYSTANITVENGSLYAGTSEGVVIEGKNSVTLKDTNVISNHTVHNGNQTDNFQAVMIYQSMSGDASVGEGTFNMTGGSLEAKNGGSFFVNNTTATINVENVNITSKTNEFLKIEKAGWGNSGSNGGNVNFNATNQKINGTVTVDSISNLNLSLDSNSTFNGSITNSGKTYVELKNGSKWVLTADSTITSLTCDANSISLNGHKLTVGTNNYVEGNASTGEKITFSTTSSNGGFGGGNMQQPPDMNGGNMGGGDMSGGNMGGMQPPPGMSGERPPLPPDDKMPRREF